jgi:hypothetical protein
MIQDLEDFRRQNGADPGRFAGAGLRPPNRRRND